MTWFKVSDDFHDHPKVLAAGNAAIGLFTRCGTWCSKQLTDGHVPSNIARLYGTRTEIARLLDARLWVAEDAGYWMPDYLTYNPSREKVLKDRAAAAERQRKGRESQMSRSDIQRDMRSDFDGGATDCPDPTRPDPSDYISDNPTSVLLGPTGGDNSDAIPPPLDRVHDIARLYGIKAVELAQAKGVQVPAPTQYAKKAQQSALANPDLLRLAEMFPTAPADAVAAWLHGDKHSMAYYPRVDEQPPVLRLVPSPTQETA